MPDPQKTQVTLITGPSRHYWPFALLALLGFAALMRDLTRLGALDRPYGDNLLFQMALVTVLLWALAWKFSVSRFRTYVAIIMMIVAVLEPMTGHYRHTDTFTLLQDCAYIGGALIMAWPLQRSKRTVQTFSSVEEFRAAMNDQKPQS